METVGNETSTLVILKTLSDHVMKSRSKDSDYSALDFLCDMCISTEGNIVDPLSPMFAGLDSNQSITTRHFFDKDPADAGKSPYTSCSEEEQDFPNKTSSDDEDASTSVDKQEYQDFSSPNNSIKMRPILVNGRILLEPVNDNEQISLNNILSNEASPHRITIEVQGSPVTSGSFKEASLLPHKGVQAQHEIVSIELKSQPGRATDLPFYNQDANISRGKNNSNKSSKQYSRSFKANKPSISHPETSAYHFTAAAVEQQNERTEKPVVPPVPPAGVALIPPKHIYKTTCDTYRVQVGKGSKSKPNGKFSRNARTEFDAIWLCEIALLFIDTPLCLDEVIYNGNYKCLHQRGLVTSPEDFIVQLSKQADIMRSRSLIKEDEWSRAAAALSVIMSSMPNNLFLPTVTSASSVPGTPVYVQTPCNSRASSPLPAEQQSGYLSNHSPTPCSQLVFPVDSISSSLNLQQFGGFFNACNLTNEESCEGGGEALGIISRRKRRRNHHQHTVTFAAGNAVEDQLPITALRI